MKITLIKIYLFIPFILIFIFNSCSENKLPVLDNPKGFIQLEKADNGTLSEKDGEFLIKVLLGHQKNDSGITVKYTVTSDDPSRYIDQTKGSLSIPKGEFEGEIIIKSVDNKIVDGNLEIKITLTNESSVPIGIAGGGINNISQTIILKDDDCPIVIASDYDVKVLLNNNQAPSHTQTLMPIPGTDNQFKISSIWGPNFVGWATANNALNGKFIYPVIITINPDFSVKVVGNEVPPNDSYAVGGKGTYSPCEDEFELVIEQELFSTPFTVDIVMTSK
ncbi:MAG: hypothetical protein ACK5H1_00530 [Tenacibaculum sp.]